MNYNIKRDQQILESIIDKYGQDDVIQYVNNLNEDMSKFKKGLATAAVAGSLIGSVPVFNSCNDKKQIRQNVHMQHMFLH